MLNYVVFIYSCYYSVNYAERERGLIDAMNSYLKSLDTWLGSADTLVRSDLFELESASLLRYDLSGKDKRPPVSVTMRLPGYSVPTQKVLLTGAYVPISVTPPALVLTPSTVKLLNTVSLINATKCYIHYFL